MDREVRGVRTGIVAAALTAAVLAAGAAGGQVVTDVLTIGTVNVTSGTGQVEVPIYIQDNTGTLIGRDQPAGHRITGFAVQVTYGFNACIDTPASPGQEIDKTGGILASQFADVDNRVKVANTSQSWIYSSAETNGLIPFTAAAAPGDQIGAMVFNLTGCPAGTINLVITTSGGAGATLSSDSGVSETVGDGLSVVNGAINVPPGASFFTLPPCRVADTRNPSGPSGGPSLVANAARSFPAAGVCGIPPSAQAVAINVAVVLPSGGGHLTLYPSGSSIPMTATINFSAGAIRSNNAIIPLGVNGEISVLCVIGSGTSDFVLDVFGYFE
jgi:hypothetical protein